MYFLMPRESFSHCPCSREPDRGLEHQCPSALCSTWRRCQAVLQLMGLLGKHFNFAKVTELCWAVPKKENYVHAKQKMMKK